MNSGIDNIDKRIKAIQSYVGKNGYASFDPYDGLCTPLSTVIGRSQLGLRVWQQAIRLFPINIRPLLGIKKLVHTKTVSDFASAYSILYATNPSSDIKEAAIEQLALLAKLRIPTEIGMGWGLRFRFATRYVVADESTLNSYQTINAIHAFLDGYDAFQDEQYLNWATQGCEFQEKEMGYQDFGDYMVWNYWMGLDEHVYNISGLMLGVSARMYSVTKEKKYLVWTQKLHRLICKAQNSDGSWYYSNGPRGQWYDGYHTGFILEGLSRAILYGVVDDEGDYLQKGIKFYHEELFTPEGHAGYYSTDPYPIEVQNSAQAIQTQTFLAKLGYASVEDIVSLFTATDNALWNSNGYYNYMKRSSWTYTTPMHRWGTGPMILALAHAAQYLKAEMK